MRCDRCVTSSVGGLWSGVFVVLGLCVSGVVCLDLLDGGICRWLDGAPRFFECCSILAPGCVECGVVLVAARVWVFVVVFVVIAGVPVW